MATRSAWTGWPGLASSGIGRRRECPCARTPSARITVGACATLDQEATSGPRRSPTEQQVCKHRKATGGAAEMADNRDNGERCQFLIISSNLFSRLNHRFSRLLMIVGRKPEGSWLATCKMARAFRNKSGKKSNKRAKQTSNLFHPPRPDNGCRSAHPSPVRAAFVRADHVRADYDGPQTMMNG